MPEWQADKLVGQFVVDRDKERFEIPLLIVSK